MLFARGLQLVTRPGVLAVFDLYQVYLPYVSFEIASSAQFPMRSSVLHLMQVQNGRRLRFNDFGSNQNSIRATY